MPKKVTNTGYDDWMLINLTDTGYLWMSTRLINNNSSNNNIHQEIRRSSQYQDLVSGAINARPPIQHIKTIFPDIWILIIKIRLSQDSLVFIMGILILAIRHLDIELWHCLPCSLFGPLRLIWRSGIDRWNLLAPVLQMSCSDLTTQIGYQHTGGRLNIKMPSYQCRNSHYNDKTVANIAKAIYSLFSVVMKCHWSCR